jgi:hypothetical protein
MVRYGDHTVRNITDAGTHLLILRCNNSDLIPQTESGLDQPLPSTKQMFVKLEIQLGE